jgi:hypothetical protein
MDAVDVATEVTRGLDQKTKPPVITIDEEGTKGFRKEGRFWQPNFKVAWIDFRKHLLKTSQEFATPDGTWLDRKSAQQQLEASGAETGVTADAIYERNADHFKSEEQAFKMARLLHLNMAETKAIDFNGTPAVAYGYIEDARDCGYGGGIQFASEGSPQLAGQQETLAKAVLLKFLIQENGDGCQFLQDKSGSVYCSDVATHDLPPQDLTVKRGLAEISRQGPGTEVYFANTVEAARNQLSGLDSAGFRETLDSLADISPENIARAVADDPDNPSEKDLRFGISVANRAHVAVPLFHLLAENKEEAIRTVNPIKPESRERAFSPEEMDKSRMILFSKSLSSVTARS